VATVIGHVLVDQASWRWVFYVNLPMGVAALAGLALTFPAGDTEGPERPLDLAGAALLAAATSALMLVCIWGGDRYGWGSPEVLGLIGGTVLLAVALVAREQRAGDPIVPFALLHTRPVAIVDAVRTVFLVAAPLAAIALLVVPELPLRTNDNQKEQFHDRANDRSHRLDRPAREREVPVLRRRGSRHSRALLPHGLLQGGPAPGAAPARLRRDLPSAARRSRRWCS
jgi:hypothetical protein